METLWTEIGKLESKANFEWNFVCGVDMLLFYIWNEPLSGRLESSAAWVRDQAPW